MFEAVDGLVAERAELEQRLADPSVHTDQALARRLGQRYAELTAVVKAYDEWRRLVGDLEVARELAPEDPTFADEAETLEVRRAEAAERLQQLLVPRDASDGKDAILEIKSGEGGEESALFAGDLLRMYTRYAEGRGWRVEILDDAPSDLGGVKSATLDGAPVNAGAIPWTDDGGDHEVMIVLGEPRPLTTRRRPARPKE